MPISFQVFREESYFRSTWTGELSDTELLTAYRAFFEGPEWSPGMDELADLTKADMSNITRSGIMSLAFYSGQVAKKHNLSPWKCAVIAPADLPYGFTRVYQAYVEGAPELTRTFRSISEAKDWLFPTQSLLDAD